LLIDFPDGRRLHRGMSKNALGKGLGALISGASKRATPATSSSPPPEPEPPPAAANTVRSVPLAQITPSPFQPRRTFREEALGELMESIGQHGVIQPLVVRRVNGALELIAGERRFRACQKLGLAEVPVIERQATDREVLEMALIENLQREDLNPVEEAEAYARLAKDFGLKQEEIAQRVGRNRATVANSMRLLELAPEVKDHLAQGRLSTGHAKVLLGLRDADLQKLLADKIVRQSLTVRQAERQVQQEQERSGKTTRTKKGQPAPSASEVAAVISRLQNRLRHRLATQVAIHHTDKKGVIEIEYYGNEDLERILELIGVSAE
jgi:ParB family chromosome partitioning protein